MYGRFSCFFKLFLRYWRKITWDESSKFHFRRFLQYLKRLYCSFVSSVQFQMVSMRSQQTMCAPPGGLSKVSPASPLKRFQSSSDWRCPSLVLSRKIIYAPSFHASLLLAIDGVMSLALCPRVVSQVPQHFRSSETQTSRDSCFAGSRSARSVV